MHKPPEHLTNPATHIAQITHTIPAQNNKVHAHNTTQPTHEPTRPSIKHASYTVLPSDARTHTYASHRTPFRSESSRERRRPDSCCYHTTQWPLVNTMSAGQQREIPPPAASVPVTVQPHVKPPHTRGAASFIQSIRTLEDTSVNSDHGHESSSNVTDRRLFYSVGAHAVCSE